MFFYWLGLHALMATALYLSFSRDEEVDMLQKLALTGSALVLGSVLLAGCAQVNEGLLAMGDKGKTPENAPPGYYSFESGQKYEKANKLDLACMDYCWSAELGHPKAKAKCIEIAFRAALKDPSYVCQAEDYDPKAKEICSYVFTDKQKAKKEISAVINKQKQKQMQKRIKSGEFSDFKVEEF